MSADNSKTILVVDDGIDILALVATVLEMEGYKVQTATNGREGLDAVEHGMPDLILLDLNMPVMTGWEFAREFRRNYGFSAPIIVTTACDDGKKHAEDIGAASLIPKPFDLSTLVNTVAQYAMAKELSLVPTTAGAA